MIVTNDLMQSNGQAYETGSKTKDERIAELEAQIADYKAGAAAEAKAGDEARRHLAEAREALGELIQDCEAWDEAVEKIIGRQPRSRWLDKYKQALAGQGGESHE